MTDTVWLILRDWHWHYVTDTNLSDWHDVTDTNQCATLTLMTNTASLTDWLTDTDTDLCDWGSGNPSNVHVMWGVGVPRTIHLSDTPGPGCNVWAMNRYISCGDVAVRECRCILLNYSIYIYIYYLCILYISLNYL